MLRSTLNLGILAHVDAGKTTLSERLLYEAGVLDQIGRVDDGTTQTDSLALERQRGITIRSAVVSLTIAGTSVNLIDTPGHPDFIAEVDRVLGVLDGAVLVVSAVEGVQPQTRVLMRALGRMRVPTLLFVNKIDRRGADVERVLEQIRRRLAVTAVAMQDVMDESSPAALIDALSERNEELLADYVEDEAGITLRRLRAELATQTRRALVCPVYAGSALTGEGVDALMAGLVELLPVSTGDADGPVSGSIFKIERGTAGEKVAYVRMFSGAARIRAEVNDRGDKISAINVFDSGAWVRRDAVSAGEIAKLWGLAGVQVGDDIGQPRPGAARRQFPLPPLQARVEPIDPEDHVALRSALAQLAEQDPLINVRDLAVSLYGEVQKEVIQATLAADYGIDVRFHETTPLYVERPVGIGEALEVLNAEPNPFHATIGLRVAPGPHDSGVDFRLSVDFRGVPLFVYRNLDDFAASMKEYVCHALDEGLHGWPVQDCVVTMTRSSYSVADGPPSLRGPTSTAADFRKLTPLVLMQALEAAGTTVCQPMSRVRIDAPAATLGPVLGTLGALGAAVAGHSLRGAQDEADVTVEAVMPASDVRDLHRVLPSLTSGEGVLESTPAGYEPVRGAPPSRARTMANPLNREEYLASLRGQPHPLSDGRHDRR